jgi:hypothetical protein
MQRIWSLSIVLALATATPRAWSQEWLELATDRFTVVSQLNERDTRRWAREFNQFVQALSGLMPQNEALLPPLTAVLFRRDGAFTPYRIRTESGVSTGNSAVFINYASWSLIGMPGVRGSSTDNGTVFHEAVHWYMGADPTRYPLWFREGIAEVYSTFDAEGEMAVWGRLPPNSIGFLAATGLQPMEEFLEVTQDEALHVVGTYYTQSWLFVHYLLIGRATDGGPGELAAFLGNLQSMELADAFLDAFGIGYGEMEGELRNYLRQTQINTVTSAIPPADAIAAEVRPAADEFVELSLARLAFGTNNEETLSGHLNRLAEIAPENAGRFDLMVAMRLRDGNNDVESLLDLAIRYGSRDARTYELEAAFRLNDAPRRGPLFSPGALDAVEARQIANHLVSSANLRPINPQLYSVLADVLFSVAETHDYDQVALDNAAFLYPREGIILIGQAALALATEDDDEALRLIDLALTDNYEMSAREISAARSLRQRLSP